MDKRFGLLRVLALCCLACAPALTGCSSSGGNDGGVDSGQDAGPVDAGPPDASTVDPHGLGMTCTPSDNMQGDCSKGLVCSPLAAGGGMCTQLQCAQPPGDGGVVALPHCADAGTTGRCGQTEQCIDNPCIEQSTSSSFCARGCIPSTTSDRMQADLESCQRDDFSCWTGQDDNGNTIHFCFPDCRATGNACEYGTTCDMASGQCNYTDCSTMACPNGQVCMNDAAQQGSQVCVPDCRVSGNSCPSDRTCNTGTGVCDPVVHHYGETCGTGIAECDSGSLCITFGGTTGECLQKCRGATDCTGAGNGAQCNLTLSGGTTVCAPPLCGGDGGGGMCATGLQCGLVQSPQPGGPMIEGCIPQ